MDVKKKPCKRWDCRKPFKPKHAHQVYCSKNCAPYGNFKDTQQDFKKSTGSTRKLICYYKPKG